MARLKHAIVACAAPALLIGAASAQDDFDTGAEETSGARLYARLGGGINFGASLDQDVAIDPTAAIATPANGLSTDLGSGFQGTAALGFVYPAGTRTELEYRYASLSTDALALTPAAGGGLDIAEPDRLSAHFLMSNVYYDFRNESALTPFIGVGVGGAFVTDSFGQRDAAFAWQARAGLALALSDALSVDVEYLYAVTRDLRFGSDEFIDDAAVEPARLDGDALSGSSVMASVRIVF